MTKAMDRDSKHGVGWKVLVMSVVCIIGIALFAWKTSDESNAADHARLQSSEVSPPAEGIPSAVKVEIAKPTPHGLGRTTTQPGEVHVFEAAELYAKVSGYLSEQTVDIGAHVKRGQVLATLDVPEAKTEVEEATASLERAKSVVAQTKAQLETSQAEVDAALAKVTEMEAEVHRSIAQRKLRTKEYHRIKELNDLHSIEKQIVDEKEDAMEVAIAAEGAAHAAVASAKAQVVAANARVAEAKANIVHSETDVQVSQAKLDKANVFLNYTKITSPYDGVVTFRGFHRGDFIMSRDQGAQTPLLTVARTDLMRVVVKVADPDVPYVSVGDKATIEIGSIPNKQFVGQVSRMADSEDPKQKTMRVEIDLPNPDGLLREGMYGRRTTIELEPASGALTVPSAALVGSSNGNEGKVYVVRDGKSYLAPIHIGQDNGRQMEVLSGLQPTDEVVVHYNGAIGDGTPVDAIAATETAKPEVPKAKTH